MFSKLLLYFLFEHYSQVTERGSLIKLHPGAQQFSLASFDSLERSVKEVKDFKGNKRSIYYFSLVFDVSHEARNLVAAVMTEVFPHCLVD